MLIVVSSYSARQGANTPLVYEIVGNCYGSPAAPARWHVEIHNAMIEHGFRQSTTDSCLYIKGDLRVLVYTDDCVSLFPDTPQCNAEYDSFVKMLTTKLELGDDGFQDCTDYVGMHFELNADRTAVIITVPSTRWSTTLDRSYLTARYYLSGQCPSSCRS